MLEASSKTGRPSRERTTLRVMSLNVAHGRKLARHQALLSRPLIESNLADIAAVIRREHPDVVALQEADGPSFWSGNFDHIAHLSQLSEVEHAFHGAHVAVRARSTNLSYGTALLSRWPLDRAQSHSFAPSPPTPKKGFVLSTVVVPGVERKVCVVSVHLDFLSRRQRNRQIAQMTAAVAERNQPVIVLGDMNCSWGRENGSLRTFAKKLDLHTYRPQQRIATFPARRPRRRIDWIFASREFTFAAYRSLPDCVSDHLGIVAELRLVAEK